MTLGLDNARHLLARTGFAGKPQEIRAFAELSRKEAVERLLAGLRKRPLHAPPAWHLKDNKKQKAKAKRLLRREFQTWWLQETLTTPSPFTEKLTLFWHNHFVSGFDKVKWTALLVRQNLLLREHSAGNFRQFCKAISRDAAMLHYLDNNKNIKQEPNENYARELLELFTLGEGNYSEKDIKEAARAFTGWGYVGKTGEFVVREKHHDKDNKTFLGKTGKFDGDDIVDIVLEQPRCAEYIAEKMWLEFASHKLDKDAIGRMAKAFRESNYEISALLKAMLMDDAFYADTVRGQRIKSPMELTVGTLRSLSLQFDELGPLVGVIKRMGQNIGSPPNVKGWPGGRSWVTTSSYLTRQRAIAQVTRGQRYFRNGGENAIQEWLSVPDRTPDEILALAIQNLLASEPTQEIAAIPQGDALMAILEDPAYQVF